PVVTVETARGTDGMLLGMRIGAVGVAGVAAIAVSAAIDACSLTTDTSGLVATAADAGDSTADAAEAGDGAADAGLDGATADADLDAAIADGVAPSRYAAEVLADHPIVYYRLDEDVPPV